MITNLFQLLFICINHHSSHICMGKENVVYVCSCLDWWRVSLQCWVPCYFLCFYALIQYCDFPFHWNSSEICYTIRKANIWTLSWETNIQTYIAVVWYISKQVALLIWHKCRDKIKREFIYSTLHSIHNSIIQYIDVIEYCRVITTSQHRTFASKCQVFLIQMYQKELLQWGLPQTQLTQLHQL